ncbi:MAG: V-type ATP synthase subunit D [Lentisphaerae bacterium]|nr:V-type ATP synthase subunit D [Lentisphaerota bacterium]
MARIKHTKTELKAQGDALKRYQRFLPMLQLKKQQLQLEIAAITARLEAVVRETAALQAAAEAWLALFSDGDLPATLVTLEEIVTDKGNIAGVVIPLYRGIRTRREALDLFATPAWHDDAQALVEARLALAAQARILAEQRRLITQELTTTSQRVNLFEKIKIPACRENIRVIRIHLGDEQTAGVARGKLAKKRGGTEQEEDVA